MGNSWQVNYGQIKDFVAKHPSIQIRPDVLSIPSDVRQEFYSVFNSIKSNFVKDHFSGSLQAAQTLSNKHAEVILALNTAMGLTGIDVESGLNDFLRNPGETMAGLLTEPVFDLLMGKIDTSGFEEISTAKVKTAFDSFLHQSYLSWLTLSLIRLTQPDQAYIVPLSNDISAPCDCDIGTPGTGHLQMPPDSELANRVSFDRTPFFAFLVPKVIVHSKRLNLFVSFLHEFRDVTTQVRYPNEQQEWFSLTEMMAKLSEGKRWPDIVVYLGKKANDLLIVADMRIMARPDIILNTLYKKDMNDSGKLATIKRHHEHLNPRLSSYVICPDGVSADEMIALKSQLQASAPGSQLDSVEGDGAMQTSVSASDQMPPTNIQVLAVGYEAQKLEPIAADIIQSQRYTELVSNPS